MSTSRRRTIEARPGRRRGMVLLLCLMLLCSLTLVGLSATADSVLQGQVAANQQDSERARQTALTALSWAEGWLRGRSGGAPEVCGASCEGLKVHAGGSLPVHPERETAAWWAANGQAAGIDPLTGTVLTPIESAGGEPVYWLLESVHDGTNADGTATLTWYRILVRAGGRRKSALSVVESLFERAWPPPDGSADDAPTYCNATASAGACGRIAWRALRR